MLNSHYEKILTHIFSDKTYSEEQKLVMIHSLTISMENENMSIGNRRFFTDTMQIAGFVFMDNFISYAEKTNKSTDYLFEVLRSLNQSQMEKYAMLFLLFVNDCHLRNEDSQHTHTVLEHILTSRPSVPCT
jgi:lipopolysaccharide assembly outer membrane protein LptD (OstA)